MYVGILEFDVLLGGADAAVDSLKHKRAILRPVLARLRRLDVSVAETGDHDLLRRAGIGVAVVSGDAGHLTEVLDICERQVAEELELGLLAARRRIIGPHDD